jgi:flagellar hook-length control protein FliK
MPTDSPTAATTTPTTTAAKPLTPAAPGPATAKPDVAATPAAPPEESATPPATPPVTPQVSPSVLPAAAPAAPAAVPGPVTDPAPAVRAQVFEKVTSLVSRGAGTHRLTLTLQPEQLGEVRVVMTVRDGTVQVRLAAGGHEARAALRDGVPDLHRLLQATGATDTRVVVRELVAAAPADGGQGATTWTGSQPDRSPQHQQHAATRADQPATDGDPTTPRPARPRDQVTTTPTAHPAGGVDVTV